MSGLCDVTGGLSEGTGLQFQTQIGSAGLTINLSTMPTSFFLLEDGMSYILLEDGTSKLGLEH